MFLIVGPHRSRIQIRKLIFSATPWLRDAAYSKLVSDMEEQGINYKDWGQDKLIERVTFVENQLRELNKRYLFLLWLFRQLGLKLLLDASLNQA